MMRKHSRGRSRRHIVKNSTLSKVLITPTIPTSPPIWGQTTIWDRSICKRVSTGMTARLPLPTDSATQIPANLEARRILRTKITAKFTTQMKFLMGQLLRNTRRSSNTLPGISLLGISLQCSSLQCSSLLRSFLPLMSSIFTNNSSKVIRIIIISTPPLNTSLSMSASISSVKTISRLLLNSISNHTNNQLITSTIRLHHSTGRLLSKTINNLRSSITSSSNSSNIRRRNITRSPPSSSIISPHIN
mmetsp:Transcript_23005/g.42942  ORF Transcript_23005/g.42942 Transcript_23005/m.42942 type:complete len:246 (-) Transcript_23005:3908-4645(-)